MIRRLRICILCVSYCIRLNGRQQDDYVLEFCARVTYILWLSRLRVRRTLGVGLEIRGVRSYYYIYHEMFWTYITVYCSRFRPWMGTAGNIHSILDFLKLGCTRKFVGHKWRLLCKQNHYLLILITPVFSSAMDYWGVPPLMDDSVNTTFTMSECYLPRKGCLWQFLFIQCHNGYSGCRVDSSLWILTHIFLLPPPLCGTAAVSTYGKYKGRG